jgi:hypothetical protein
LRSAYEGWRAKPPAQIREADMMFVDLTAPMLRVIRISIIAFAAMVVGWLTIVG